MGGPEVRLLPVFRDRAAPFAYACHGCGRCCHHKGVRVGPYEAARLADALGTTTTDVLDRYVDQETATLRAGADGACVFLVGGGCSVHSGRPLACRLYPLGRVVSPARGEVFVELPAHPESDGVYGDHEDGGGPVVQDYLDAQGTAPYERAAALYAAVLGRLEALYEAGAADGAGGPDTSGPLPPVMDVDRAVAGECAALGVPVPEGVEGRVALHLEALHRWLDAAGAPGGGDAGARTAARRPQTLRSPRPPGCA